MKKKILALCLVVALAATAVIGGTLAYFTDTDKADNVFTVGGVKIDLIEQERDGNGRLRDFSNNKVLMPIVGSAQDTTKQETVNGWTGLPTAGNWVDKIITVKNTGASDAYMKVFVAIPAELDNIDDAGKNVLHYNTTKQSNTNWTAEKLEAKDVTIGGIAYNVYSRICKDIIAPNGATATPAYIGFYLDKNVDMDAQGNYVINGKTIGILKNRTVTIPVFAQGIQAAGFKATETQTAAEVAFAQSGLPTNPWATPAA